MRPWIALGIRYLMFPLLIATSIITLAADETPQYFLETYCFDCHDSDVNEGGLDLTTLKVELSDDQDFAKWVKIYDRVDQGEMPPRDADRPSDEHATLFKTTLRESLIAAEKIRLETAGRTPLRRLTRAEYENTMRDLFDMPGIAIAGGLPADGSAHGFDKNSDALDISRKRREIFRGG